MRLFQLFSILAICVYLLLQQYNQKEYETIMSDQDYFLSVAIGKIVEDVEHIKVKINE